MHSCRRVLPLVCFPLFLLCGCSNLYNPYLLAPDSSIKPWQCPSAACFPALCTFAPNLAPPSDGPLHLPDLVNVALQNSPLTQTTWANARAAAATYASELSQLLPDIALNGNYLREKTPIVGISGAPDVLMQNATTYGPQLTLSMLLFDAGATYAAASSLKQNLYAANWAHNRQIQTVVQNVLDAYFNYENYSGLLTAATATYQDNEVLLQAAMRKRTSGVFDYSDELSALAQLCQAQLTVLKSKQNMENAKAQLINDLGYSANTWIQIAEMREDFPYEKTQTAVDDLLAQGFKARADLLSAQAQVLANTQILRQTKRNLWPTLNFSGNLGRTYFNGGIKDDYDYQATFTLSLPLFKGFYYRNQIKQAEANLASAQGNLQKLSNAVGLQITQSYQNFTNAADQVAASREYLFAAQKSYEASLQKYAAGTTDFTTLSNALNSLAQARSSLVSSQTAWFTALIDLSYATGCLPITGKGVETQLKRSL